MNPRKTFHALALTLLVAACGESGTGVNNTAGQAQHAPPPEPPCRLVMGWDPWEPYQYEIAGGHVFGLDVDILTAVTRNAGCQIAFRRDNWRELLNLLELGEVDLVAGATRTPDREAFAYFTQPYRQEEFYLYVSRDRLPEIHNWSLVTMLEEGLRIGVTEGYLYGEPVANLQDDPAFAEQFVYSSMAETNFGRLLDGDVEGVIEDRFVGASIIRHKSLQDLVAPHPVRFPSSPVNIMVSRTSVSDEVFDAIDRSVRELIMNGAIDMILAQYQNP